MSDLSGGFVAKRLFGFVLCCLPVIFTSGCKNGNVFSWAHHPGNGSYDSLISDADSEMRAGNFAKAAEYYESAARKNPGSERAAMGAAAATINASGVRVAIANIAAKMKDIPHPGERLLDFIIATFSAKKRREVLSKLVNNENMVRSLLKGGGLPKGIDINLCRAIFYATDGMISALENSKVKEALKKYNVNVDIFSDNIDKNGITRAIDELLSHSNDNHNPEVELEVRNMKDKVLKAVEYLDNIKDEGQIAKIVENLKLECRELIVRLDSWLNHKQAK
jgi:tetratricopeptide (TPR) repeat protein